MNFYALDAWKAWDGPAVAAAKARGYEAKIIASGTEVIGNGLGFIRPYGGPRTAQTLQDDLVMRSRLTMIQDRTQLEVFENKSEQFRRWAEWMPRTWRFESKAEALALIDDPRTPDELVSKADEGASSYNIRILSTREQQRAHVLSVFDKGVPVQHCGGHKSVQKDYVVLQEFIPHKITYRVNIIGRARAVFLRSNYPDRNVAQTGNVKPVMALDATTEHLLSYSDRVFDALKTKWCAIDILWDDWNKRWVFLECSLGWPWPSPGECMNATFFGDTKRKWSEMWELMFDEYEAGAWT